MVASSLKENGPVVLVPSAWTVAGAAHAGVVPDRTLLIAHVVMAFILGVFALASWSEMAEGVLRVWRGVLVAGFFLTVTGALGLLGAPGGAFLRGVSLYGWFLAPAAGLAHTARETDAPHAYSVGATLSLSGAVVYTVALVLSGDSGVAELELAGVTLTGVGQTVGIGDAVYRY